MPAEKNKPEKSEPVERIFAQDDLLPEVELWRGAYVKLQVGPHTGLYGWVIRQMCDNGVWYVAVGDRCDLTGLYQWFRVRDVWPADTEEEETAAKWRELPRAREPRQ